MPQNEHDILTGSTLDGRAFTDNTRHYTCNNWTNNAHVEAAPGRVPDPPPPNMPSARVGSFGQRNFRPVVEPVALDGFTPVNAELLKDATPRVADILFDRDDGLDRGGVRVRAILVGPTNTKGDAACFVEVSRCKRHADDGWRVFARMCETSRMLRSAFAMAGGT